MPWKRKTGSPERLAAIDVGTNSFHLIIAEIDPVKSRFRIAEREKENVRLGSGSTDMKHISEAAMARGIGTLRRFKMMADAAEAKVRAVATSAVREAINQDLFLRRVRSETGIRLEVASGQEEARLIYLGILQALPIYIKSSLCIDIGGGSTEYLVGKRKSVLASSSIKLGALRLSQRFFPEGKSNPKSLKECRKHISGMLSPIVRQICEHDYELAAGSSGTINTIGRIIHHLHGEANSRPINNFTFTRENLDEAAELIYSCDTPAERTQIEGLDPSRSDIITAGMLILEQSFREFNLSSMIISEYALREGIICDTIERRRQQKSESHVNDIRYHSVLQLSDSFQNEISHGNQVAKLALSIYDQIRPHHQLGAKEREYLQAAALLHEVGLHVSHTQHHRHSYYLIRNAELLGFTENEKEIIANIARYHRKSHPKIKHEGFAKLSADDQDVVGKLAGILRIADGLDRTHRASVKSIKISFRRNNLTFSLLPFRQRTLELELWGADRKKELFEESFSCHVKFKTS